MCTRSRYWKTRNTSSSHPINSFIQKLTSWIQHHTSQYHIYSLVCFIQPYSKYTHTMSFVGKLAGSLSTAILGSPLKNSEHLNPSSPLNTRLALLEDCSKLAHLGREIDGKIVTVVEQSADDEVNSLLSRFLKNGLLAKVEDHKLGPAWRSRLLDILSSERLNVVSEENRMALLVALASLNEWNQPLIIAAKNLLLSLTPALVIQLKRAWDSLDNTSTAQIVEAWGVEYRWRVSSFINLQSAATLNVEGKAVQQRFKFFSDIDDTLYASLKDFSFPNRKCYPGVLALYAALQAGPDGAAADVQELYNLVFLTARPQFLESFTQSRLVKRGVKGGSVLSGSLRTIFSSESMAQKKEASFDAFEALYPECRFCFMGDSGQGDVLLAQSLLKNEPGEEVKLNAGAEKARSAKGSMEFVLIHDIQTKSQEPNSPIAKRIELQKENIYVFDSYLMAAVIVYCKGLISAESLRFVKEEAFQELSDTDFGSDKYDSKKKRLAEFNFAKHYADNLLARANEPRQIKPLSPDEMFSIGQVGHCNFYQL